MGKNFMKMKTVPLIFAFFFNPAASIDNGVGKAPQMAWNSWNKFACDINEYLIM